MRSYWVLAVTLALVLIFQLWGGATLNRISESGQENARTLAKAARAEDWPGARQALEALERDFEQEKRLLSLLLEHSHGQNMESCLARAAIYADLRDAPELELAARELELAYAGIVEATALTWENVI